MSEGFCSANVAASSKEASEKLAEPQSGGMWVHSAFCRGSPCNLSSHLKVLYSLPRPFVRDAIRRWFLIPEQRRHPSSSSAVCTGAARGQVPQGLPFD